MIGAMLAKWEVRRGFDMMSRKDLATLMRGYTNDAVFEFPGWTPISGRHEGKPAIEAFFRTVFDRMASMRFTVKRVAALHRFALNLTNTLLIEWAADETSYDGITIHVEGVTICRIHHGRTVATRDYIFDTGPLETMWGHVEAAPAQTADRSMPATAS
jgi:ketosteroid isomerase-like protein